MKRLFSTLFSVCICIASVAQTITVKDTIMTTYPYGDPDPVARTGKIYPYWRFQGFSRESVRQTWKMVVLENAYLRVKIFPEIGGKLWSIYDKKAGKELVYDNDVVKFRDISLRGPWTSGGIEFNYGVIGHAPSCASPVDWDTEYKDDGSVSCYVGVMDMTSRSRWTVEINLPSDAAWCRTGSIWYNLSGEWQPYYSWFNSAVETADDLILTYPADNAVGHKGELLTYPLNESGTDISVLGNQAYGKDKSYHMIGSHKSYFGAYYPSSDWGSMHWSLRDEKLGRKYFTWAQSSQGSIWVDLLTDSRPQYVELQSGRLYNQNEFGSCASSPYRQVLFTPYGTEGWNEYWFPYSGIGKVGNATLDAVISTDRKGRNSIVGIYPLRAYSGEVSVSDENGEILYSGSANLRTSEVFSLEFKGVPATIKFGRKTVWTSDDGKVDRPQQRNASYTPSETEKFTLLARDCMGLRMFGEAENYADSALVCDNCNIGALCLKSALLYRKMDYAGAYKCSDAALAIDQYCQEAGYFGALAAVALGKNTDAMDRFEIAAIGGGALRGACMTELARLHFRLGDAELAAGYARKALLSNSRNITAMMILAETGDSSRLEQIRTIDPLNHYPAARKFLDGKISASELAATFKDELPWEDYIELALFYHSLGLDTEAAGLLDVVPDRNILTALWSAYLKKDSAAVSKALCESIDYAFPFRAESAKMLQWAASVDGSWKCRYLLALLKANFGYNEEAAALLAGNDSDYAPYYAFRYSLSNSTDDLRRSFELEQNNPQYRRMLAIDLIEKGEFSEATDLLEAFYSEHPDDFKTGDALMDAYIGLGRFKDAEKIIDSIVYLPFEGQRGSHDKYRHIKLHLAAIACDEGKYDDALALVDEALQWPERLGAGKPYDDLIDTSLEEWVRGQITARKDGRESGQLLPLLDDQRTADKKLF